MSNTSCERIKFFGLEFQDDCLCSASILSRSSPYLFRKPPNLLLDFREGYIDLESIFSGDGFAHPIRNNRIVIDATGELIEASAVTAEVIFEIRSR